MFVMSDWRLMDPAGPDGAPGGGGSEPAAAPPSGDSGGEPNLFSELAEHDDTVEVVAADPSEVAPPAAPAAPVSPPAAAVSPPAAPPAPAPGSPSPPAGAPAAASAVQPPGAPAAGGPSTPPASGEPAAPAAPAVPFDAAKHREEFLPKLAEHYKLDDADVEALRTDPGKVMPTLAARLHYDVQHAITAGLVQMLPQMIGTYFQQQKAAEENESAFFSAYPTLKEKPEYAQTVINSIAAVRHANPQITREELIKQAGIMASLSLGLPLPGATPAAPPAAAPVPAARPAPGALRPAGAGTSGHVPTPIAPGTPAAQTDLDGLIDAHLNGEI